MALTSPSVRPAGVETPPSVRPADAPAAPGRARRALAWAWIWQVVSGALLLVLLTLHIVVEHFLPGGLRNFTQIMDWLGNPVVLGFESLFLGVVTWHALLGVRSILLDLGPSHRAEPWITRGLTAIGVTTVAYGMWLLVYLTTRW